MKDHEIKFPATTAGDEAADAEVERLSADPNVFELAQRKRRDGAVINYKTRD